MAGTSAKTLNHTITYSLYGALFGCCFPVFSTLFDLYIQQLDLTITNIIHIQSSQPLHWVIDTAPLFLGLFSSLAGRRQDQIAKINLSLASERDRAEAANRTKSTFLANMSHELRTPLNAIMGYSDMLIEEANDLAQPTLVPDLNKIKYAGHHLLDIITGILDLSKIEAGKMDIELEKFAVAPEIHRTLEIAGPLIEDQNNQCTVELPDDLGEIFSDRVKLQHILYNLLSNAGKFTRDGHIYISATRQAEEITIAVRDTGIGMEQDHVESLFQAFTQADNSSTRAYEGIGLGLTIVQRFAGLLGGQIEVLSEPGAGSTFTMRLPVDSRNCVAHSGDLHKKRT